MGIFTERGEKRVKRREIGEKEIGHSYLNFNMWPILHSHRTESAKYTCKVYGENIGQEKKGDRNEVRVTIIYTFYFFPSIKVFLETLYSFMMTISLRFTEISNFI